MTEELNLNFLNNLLTTSGPSGFETETAKVYRDYLKSFCDEVNNDVMGNTIGIINKDADFKIMLAGHYDEIGFQVVHIADEGIIHFRKVGGIDQITLPGSEVEILNENGKVPGIIGKKPIHLVQPKERDKSCEIKDLWIDIGAKDKKEAENLVSVGDPVTIKTNFKKLAQNKIMSKGLDDKLGAFVCAESARLLSQKISKKIGIYCVGTVQEEVGLRGAITSSYNINPNVGIAVDLSFATDTPDISKSEYGEVKLGAGPMLTRFANENLVVSKKIRQIASEKSIPYQESAGHTASGGTDTAMIQLSRNGVATTLVSIPSRYMHTPVEICNLEDVNNAVELISEFSLSLSPNEKLNVPN